MDIQSYSSQLSTQNTSPIHNYLPSISTIFAPVNLKHVVLLPDVAITNSVYKIKFCTTEDHVRLLKLQIVYPFMCFKGRHRQNFHFLVLIFFILYSVNALKMNILDSQRNKTFST
jgi:hypothetical protein